MNTIAVLLALAVSLLTQAQTASPDVRTQDITVASQIIGVVQSNFASQLDVPLMEPTPNTTAGTTAQTAQAPQVATAPSPAPQFVQAPTFVRTINADGTIDLQISFKSDINATAEFLLSPYRDDAGSYTVQSSAQGTDFSMSINRPRSIVEFYKVKLTANGQETFFGPAQRPQ